GVGFNDNGMHDFHDITLIGCGTFNDTNNNRVGAINITGASSAGTKVQNIRFYNININDSKCDAIRFFRNSGAGFSNINFANNTVIGTGKEYPNNNANNSTQGQGYVAIFENNPSGSAAYCGMNYSNLGGNANGVAFYGMGNFKWTAQTGCDYISVFGVSLSQNTFSLAGGAKVQLNTFFNPANATNQIVEYTSDNTTVATVDYTGLVTAVGKGSATITAITLEGGKTDACLITVTSDPTIVYRIKNRWQNTYLYDGGDRVKYSNTAIGNTYLWKLEDIDGVKEIMNFSTGDYMHNENLLGYVQCTTRVPGAMSSRWSLEDAGDGFVRLKSEWNTLDYINVE
ncbi:MAG TPA: Ig-like domain-containing protein, partial [Prolixibacteraceae bacterium]